MFSGTLRVYEHYTREISPLPRQGGALRWPTQAMRRVQTYLEDKEEKERQKEKKRQQIKSITIFVPPNTLALRAVAPARDK